MNKKIHEIHVTKGKITNKDLQTCIYLLMCVFNWHSVLGLYVLISLWKYVLTLFKSIVHVSSNLCMI